MTDPPPGNSVVGKIEPSDCRGTQKGKQFARSEGRGGTERGSWERPENTGAGPYGIHSGLLGRGGQKAALEAEGIALQRLGLAL